MKNKRLIRVSLRKQSVSPKKARLVMNMVKNKPLVDATNILANTNKKTARLLHSLLKSGEAAAKDKGYKGSDLMVCEALANEGKRLKRYFIKARGRSTKFQKRSSHLTISLCKIQKEDKEKITKGAHGKKD